MNVDKRKIGFFAGSVDGWFRDQADGAITEYLLAPQPHYADVLDPQVVRSLVRLHADAPGRVDSRLLLAILMLEVWLSSFLPRALAQTNGRPIEVPVRPPALPAAPVAAAVADARASQREAPSKRGKQVIRKRLRDWLWVTPYSVWLWVTPCSVV